MKPNEIAAKLHAHLCVCPKHGYSQGNARYGNHSYTCPVEIDGKTYHLWGGDRDCSSSVCDVWQTALKGTPYEGALDGATYTGNMRRVFVDSGLFDWHPMGDGYIAQTGDVYLNEQKHTAMCQTPTPDMLSEFYINEYGGIIGGQEGDQTGRESRIVPYYGFPWDGILAYNHKADTEDDMPTAKEIASEVWAHKINGHSAGERLYLDNKQLFDRKDYSGRGMDGCTPIERITWLAAKVDKLQASVDKLTELLDK